MTNQQLVDYIRQQRRQGRTEDQIKSALVPSGWLASDIEEAFREVDNISHSELAPVRNKKILKLCLTIFILALIGGGAFYVVQKTDILTNPGVIIDKITSLWPGNSVHPIAYAPDSAVSSNTEQDNFLNSLSACSTYTGTFEHPLTGDNLERKIIGLSAGKCVYEEKLPNGGKMTCNYSESLRVAVAQFYRDGVGENTSKTYLVDGKTVTNPIKEAADTGACVI